MKKLLPIGFSMVIVLCVGFVVVQKKSEQPLAVKATTQELGLGEFKPKRSCARLPKFLKRMHITQPVMIDLSQKRFKGIALYHGQKLQKVLHPKMWEKYEHFSTYALDKEGNIFLAPSPFISIRANTFALQTNIYKLDSKTGKIERFMHLKDVHPSAQNPYGINALVYDCDDETLWVSAIDETSYDKQRGTIYHIDIKTKKILQKLEGLDALSLALVRSEKEKHLLVGGSRKSVLYAYQIVKNRAKNRAKTLLTLPNANEFIRKIKVKAKNTLELQTIPFMYSLITQTAKKDRKYYLTAWDEKLKSWVFK